MSLFYEPYRRNIKKDRTLSKISNFRSFRNSKYSELLPSLTKIERCLLLGNPGQQDGFAPAGRSQNEVKKLSILLTLVFYLFGNASLISRIVKIAAQFKA